MSDKFGFGWTRNRDRWRWRWRLWADPWLEVGLGPVSVHFWWQWPSARNKA